jgi:5-methylcytosine-specific restriction protein A
MPTKAPHPCVVPGCRTLVSQGSRCEIHAREHQGRAETVRPSAARRGYGADWRKKREAFLHDHPTCEDCGRPAVIPDHVPSRRELVKQGVPDPDADQYLHACCRACHNRRTNAQEGGGWHGRGD